MPEQAPASAAPATRGQGGRRPSGRRDNRRDMPREEKQFEEIVVNIDRVARVVKGGRRFRFKALVVVGDRKARVGVGVSKGQDVQSAVSKATDVAKKHMVTIPVVNTTIPHDVEVKLSGARVLLKPAAPGTGIIAGGVVRAIIGATGISNLLSKSLGSTNKVNIAYATVQALGSLVPAEEWHVNKTGGKAPRKKEETKTGKKTEAKAEKPAEDTADKKADNTSENKTEKKTEKKPEATS